MKLGLVPATISPYVIAAMGERAAYRYMLTAEPFDAAEAYRIGFVQEIALDEELDGVINAGAGSTCFVGAPGRARRDQGAASAPSAGSRLGRRT